MSSRLPGPCAVCGRWLTPADAWVVGHIKSRATHPELTFAPSNYRLECDPCSRASAQSVVQEKARLSGWLEAGRSKADFPGAQLGSESPPLTNLSLQLPEAISVDQRLRWDARRLSAAPWLYGLLAVPGDASVPLAMTGVHPRAVGTYGWRAVEWIEGVEGKRLRWWQRLCLVRMLEHDAAGALVWRTVVQSASRRSGKTLLMRGLALWRLAHGRELFGERQEVVHTGSDLTVCRKCQREAWRWAEAQGWRVVRGNGKEAVETTEDDAWLVRAQTAVYGWDTTLALGDECWDVEPSTISEGLAPSLLERQSPQLVLTSTAHTRATSLMRRRISDALAADDGETLLLLWAAEPDADLSDPEAWRAASPHWSEDRARMLAAEYERAARGEASPEADEPDPLEAFASQFLNRWRLTRTADADGVVTSPAAWESLTADLGADLPDGVAVEGWAAGGLSVAAAWRRDGLVTVSAVDVPDVASAAELVKAYGCRRAAVVGTSLAADPAWQGVRVEARSGTPLAAVTDLAGLLRDAVLRHDGGQHLAQQVLGVQTSATPTGLRLRSAGRLDAIKACVWAVGAARKPSRGPVRVLVAQS